MDGYTQRELLGLEPFWHEVGFWYCPICWEEIKRRLGHVQSLRFGPAGGYRVGCCRYCEFVWRFVERFGWMQGTREPCRVGDVANV